MSLNALEFSRKLDSFVADTKRKEVELFRRVDAHVGQSIRTGSAITGAPGQPVKTGFLLASWKRRGSIEARRVTHYTNCAYAGIIEENLRGATLRSAVGGFHSVALTAAGFRNLVRFEIMQVKAAYAISTPFGYRDVMSGRFTARPR